MDGYPYFIDISLQLHAFMDIHAWTSYEFSLGGTLVGNTAFFS